MRLTHFLQEEGGLEKGDRADDKSPSTADSISAWLRPPSWDLDHGDFSPEPTQSSLEINAESLHTRLIDQQGSPEVGGSSLAVYDFARNYPYAAGKPGQPAMTDRSDDVANTIPPGYRLYAEYRYRALCPGTALPGGPGEAGIIFGGKGMSARRTPALSSLP